MQLTGKQLERYTRQIVLPEIGLEGQEKLFSAKVFIAGAGGLSSAVLLYLAASGVGEIGVADPDNVDFSNLHRQIIYDVNDVNKSKVVSVKEQIKKINPDVKVNVYQDKLSKDNVESILSEYEIIVDGLDNFSDKFLLNDFSVSLNKKFVHAGAIGFEGQVLTVIPKQSSCLRCYFPEAPSDFRQSCKELGVFGPCVGVISTIQANEVLKLILGIGEPLTDRILKFNALKSSFYELKVKRRNENCLVCGY